MINRSEGNPHVLILLLRRALGVEVGLCAVTPAENCCRELYAKQVASISGRCRSGAGRGCAVPCGHRGLLTRLLSGTRSLLAMGSRHAERCASAIGRPGRTTGIFPRTRRRPDDIRVGSLDDESRDPVLCVVAAQLVSTPITISTAKAATRYIQLRFLGVSLVSTAFDIFSISLVGSLIVRAGAGPDPGFKPGGRTGSPSLPRVCVDCMATNVPGHL